MEKINIYDTKKLRSYYNETYQLYLNNVSPLIFMSDFLDKIIQLTFSKSGYIMSIFNNNNNDNNDKKFLIMEALNNNILNSNELVIPKTNMLDLEEDSIISNVVKTGKYFITNDLKNVDLNKGCLSKFDNLNTYVSYPIKYLDEIIRSMNLLSSNDKTIFVGQSIKYGGTGLYDTLLNVPDEKKIEWPVAEYLQMGASIGMGLEGFTVVTLFPRWNFLLMATDQIVNHLDKLTIMSDGRCNPKLIIRVSVGSEHPVDPQCQHKGNFSDAFRLMCKTLDIIDLKEPEDIFPAYEKSLNRTDGKSTMLVEYSDFLKTK